MAGALTRTLVRERKAALYPPIVPPSSNGKDGCFSGSGSRFESGWGYFVAQAERDERSDEPAKKKGAAERSAEL